MKICALFFSVGLTIDLASGLPNPNPSSTTTVITTVSVIPVVAGSPYPASPTTNEFDYLNYDEENETDKATRTIIHTAFEDWAAVIQKALDSLGNSQDNTYKTWFPETATGNKKPVRGFLAGVFNRVFDSNADSPAPLPYVATFVCDNVDFGGINNEGICDSSTTSCFSPLLAKFHVCPVGVQQPTKANDIKCSDLGDVVSSKMNSLTGSLVHELMHSHNAGAATPNGEGCLCSSKNLKLIEVQGKLWMYCTPLVTACVLQKAQTPRKPS